MSFIALVSDSTANLYPDFVEKYGIRVIPLYIKIGDTTFKDGVDISTGEFYERLPNCDPLPITSQPSAGDFVELYQELVAAGAEAIISVHLSSGISGTINSATLAAAEMDSLPIEIVDTRCAAASHMMAVEAGALALEKGAPFEEAVAAVRRVVDQQKTVFAVDTLEYLHKGGRIGGAAALLGGLLQFKPILYFKEGKIDALERVRTSKQALLRLAEIMADWLGKEEPLQAVVMQAACPERAKALADVLPQYMNIANVRITEVPPVLGAHVGNGTVGLCCCPVSAYGPEADE